MWKDAKGIAAAVRPFLLVGFFSAGLVQGQIFFDDFEWGSICAWANLWYTDLDEDGWGDASAPGIGVDCPGPFGLVPNAGDCDDLESSTNPGADEICDNKDNDCDVQVDEDPPHSNCALPNAIPGCSSGECTIASCLGRFYDIDTIVANGCECQADEFQSNNDASSATDLGTLTPGSTASKTLNLVPEGDVDWLVFGLAGANCLDCSGVTSISISFSMNPGGAAKFDVYTGENLAGLILVGANVDVADYLCAPATRPLSRQHVALPCVLLPQRYFVRVHRPSGTTCDSFTINFGNGT